MTDKEFLENATPQMIRNITDYLFYENRKSMENLDVVILLGSRTCAYRVRQAFSLLGKQRELLWIVSGAGICGEPPLYEGAPEMTEAEYMRAVLLELGVEENRILLENKARFTGENISYSLSLLVADRQRFPADRKLRVGIATGGFHMKRVFVGLSAAVESGIYDFVTVPTYGGLTRKEDWFKTLAGVKIIHGELDRIGREDMMDADGLPFVQGNTVGHATHALTGERLVIRYDDEGHWIAFPES